MRIAEATKTTFSLTFTRVRIALLTLTKLLQKIYVRSVVQYKTIC